MKITEAKKKIKLVIAIMNEYGYLCALISSMDKMNKNGMEIDPEYYNNAKKRRNSIADKLDQYLK